MGAKIISPEAIFDRYAENKSVVLYRTVPEIFVKIHTTNFRLPYFRDQEILRDVSTLLPLTALSTNFF